MAGACFPAIYPTGEVPKATEEETIYTSKDDVEAIADFFVKELNALPADTLLQNRENLWLVFQPNNEATTDYIFECNMFYKNGFYEHSCIYTTKQDGDSVIETEWNILPTEFPPYCGA